MKIILVIEDNIEVRENLIEILELSNYKVFAADNGKTGIELAMSCKPDLILCDIMMPELDGFGVLHILNGKPELNTIPFIFLTAKSEKEDLRRGMSLGADDYIVKPFDDVELLRSIEMRLKKTERLNASLANNKIGDFLDEKKADEEIKSLSQSTELKHFKKKDYILRENSKVYFLYAVHSGKIKSVMTNDEGKEKIVNIFKKNDYFGHIELILNQPTQEDFIVLEDAEISVIPKDQFLNLLYNNRSVAFRIIKLLASNQKEIESELIKMAYNSVRKKIADALLTLHTKNEDSTEPMKILRDDLAAFVGTAKETVIRNLSDFKAERLIDIQDGKIIILNAEKLKNLAN